MTAGVQRKLCDYGHTEADHEAAGACQRPVLTGPEREARRLRADLIGSLPGAYPWHEIVDAHLLPTVQRLIERAEKRAAAAAIDVGHLEHQREWSRATFGPGDRRKGVLDHIRKELVEIEEAGEHTDEWIDVVILALDGAWRDGYEPAEIIAAIKAKQAKNERRTWPDWRTADPDKAIEHDRALDPSGATEGAGR